MFGGQQELRHPNQLLWSSTVFSLAMLLPSVLRPRLYIRARPYLTFAARIVLGVLMPQLIYELAKYPYKGSSIITYTPGAFAAVWWYNSRWLGELVSPAAHLVCAKPLQCHVHTSARAGDRVHANQLMQL